MSWTFLTNHADALLCIARDPGVRLRDLALMVGVTERAAQRIVNDLVAAGYVSRARVGSRNVYTVNPDRHLRRPIVRHSRITALLALLDDEAEDRRAVPAHGPLDPGAPDEAGAASGYAAARRGDTPGEV